MVDLADEPFEGKDSRTIELACKVCGKTQEISVAASDHLLEQVFKADWGYKRTSDGKNQFFCPDDGDEESKRPWSLRET